MIAKVIAWGRDRDEALARLRRALRRARSWCVEGGTTNQGFLLDAARPPGGAGRRGRHHLARPPAAARRASCRSRHADVALLQAAIELGEAETAADRARFYALRPPRAAAGRAASGRAHRDLRHRGQAYRLARLADRRPTATGSTVDGVAVEVERRARRARTSAGSSLGGAHAPDAHLGARAPTCSSRSTASRTGSRATTAASCAASPPRSSSSIPVADGRRGRRPATSWPCSRA